MEKERTKVPYEDFIFLARRGFKPGKIQDYELIRAIEAIHEVHFQLKATTKKNFDEQKAPLLMSLENALDALGIEVKRIPIGELNK